MKKTWSLDEFFKGGSTSKELQKALKSWSAKLASLQKNLVADEKCIQLWQELSLQLQQVQSFVHCLRAQNVHDEDAGVLEAHVEELSSNLAVLSNELLELVSKESESQFKKLLVCQKSIAFSLEQNRKWHKAKLSVEKENLLEKLAPSGYHSWYQLYSSAAGQIRVLYKESELSFAEVDNLLDHADRKVRKEVFHAWEKSCKDNEYLFCHTLNHLSGYRLKMYEARKWSVLQEACFHNNIQEKSLSTMWSVVEDNKAPFVAFLKAKQKLLGVKKLSWYDQDISCDSIDKKITYKDAAGIIERSFHACSPDMAKFSTNAIKNQWVDAENRRNKAPGGFCTPFPLSNQSRIFMTYADTFQNLLTLAHEIGHAYHSDVLFHKPYFAQNYPMTLAETASTFAEHLVMNKMLDEASAEDKRAILHNKADRSVTFFMNIHARFIFERQFYEQRKKGVLVASEICDMMQNAQRLAFCNMFEEYHPYFWITKQHFHFSHMPFYNFPYTVGYLFSLALVAKAKNEPKTFAKRYVAFLEDSASMSIEDVAKKHFQADLSKRTFWQTALDVAIDDINEFLNAST